MSVNPHPEPRLEGGLARLPKNLSIEDAYRVLAEALPGYEHRPEQYELSRQIYLAVANGNNLAAEAPTGTGKSFAVGLALAAYLSSNRGKRVVVATGNNNLLEQYAKKDFPFLAELFPGLSFARAKGKNNYACMLKGEEVFGQQVLLSQTDSLKRLRRWFDRTSSGDKEEISFAVPSEEWLKINADDGCTGKKCPFYGQCHYYRAKSQLQDVDVVITNHDMVLLDAFIPMAQLLPGYDVLVIDEAHGLEAKAIDKLQKSLTERQVNNYIREAERRYEVGKGICQQVALVTAELFNEYRDFLPMGEDKKSITPTPKLVELTQRFEAAMRTLRQEVGRYKVEPDTRPQRLRDNLMKSITEASCSAKAAISHDETHVSWVEKARSDVKVVNAPFRVGGMLHRALFSRTGLTTICLSATLGVNAGRPKFSAVGGGLVPAIMFEEFRKSVGFLECAEFNCPSPFDYRRNALLVLPEPPEGVTTPNHGDWFDWAVRRAIRLIGISQGRAFLLSTSTANMRKFGERLAAALPYPVKCQGNEANSSLIDWFRNTDGAVLVATASFWEGVSIEGDDLKLVIIDKIPFTVHTDPIQKAKEAYYKKNPALARRSFMDLQLYPAIIRLKQGFGRLIRTKNDSGVVAILDPRLLTARYRGVVLNSLPDAQKVHDVEDERIVEMFSGKRRYGA